MLGTIPSQYQIHPISTKYYISLIYTSSDDRFQASVILINAFYKPRQLLHHTHPGLPQRTLGIFKQDPDSIEVYLEYTLTCWNDTAIRNVGIIVSAILRTFCIDFYA
jgi:hypothetical protein